ncbi:NADH:ubiquinone oxidoreductase subunit NDUFA12 [Rubrimonas cliftonensis]|uniref:NADH:ubiquinone oxidoreductase subunit n=1 Tax=Rubrimonas cliftonensis TaxID=89524 RepID=A0A1H3YKA1_9RHOB|nr:NADH:ubiquinone oxidoreductase subunit NDUFA12 [Rubrimonas cliftonensis]SEA11378.1 NADH:ubiquinone oxidoreductase subunit [Rubrimonas cliftonensis]
MSVINRIFTWWNGSTVGTLLDTRRHGERVGEDEAGNVFYRSRDGKRRWVLFNGESEASRVSPDWHGWLHHTYDAPPTEAPLLMKPWEKPHAPNLTGTAAAYAPPGSVLSAARRPKAGGDYEAWSPE